MNTPRETVMLGVKEDCEKFIQLFSKKPDLDYSHFVQIWKSLNFGYIYCGRPSIVEMRHFTQHLFNILKSFLSDTYSVAERVCALYLLYVLYYIQPLKKRIKIRIELNEWEDLWFFVNGNKNDCIEIGYCFYRLVTSNAFDFVYSTEFYNPETAKKRVRNAYVNRQMKSENNNVKRFSEDLMKEVGLDETLWQEYETEYNSLKQEIEKLSLTDTSSFSTRQFLEPILRPTTSVVAALEDDKSKVKKTTEGTKRSRLLEKALKDEDLYEKPVESVEEPSTLSMPGIEESSTSGPNLGQ